MNSTTKERQDLEITALRSIYGDNFFDTPTPRAWKGAVQLPEFTIRVKHPDYDNFNFHLNVKFPKTYPSIASPIFLIQKPIEGLFNDQVLTLTRLITSEAQSQRGTEMVFRIVDLCQDWMTQNIKPPKEVTSSLAVQMNQRAMENEKARRERESEEAEQAKKIAREKEEMFQEEAMRELLAREQQYKARKRANSEATETTMTGGDTMTETFSHKIETNGISFDTVKLFHPCREGLGTTYLADPICDDVNTTLPLELFVVNFFSSYYSTSPGRKKLKILEAEIQRLTNIRHSNLTSVLAVKLTLSHSEGPSQLMVLSEQPPAMTLQDVLEDCESFREERASDYLGQILSGLNALHAGDIVHRGINIRSIALISPKGSRMHSKVIKLGRAAFPTRLLDLHRSNPFGPNIRPTSGEPEIPDAWLPREVKNESSLLYTPQRDIHAVGIVLLQMLLGLDVVERYSDIHMVLDSSRISPALARHALNMILPSRKSHSSTLTLLGDLAQTAREVSSPSSALPVSRTSAIPISTTSRAKSIGVSTSLDVIDSSPEGPMGFYFPRQKLTRWKQDWEELELLGKGAFGSVVKARNKIDNRTYAVKKISLKTAGTQPKIFREVTALSRLSHRYIVRYFTTWVETSEDPFHDFASDIDTDGESENTRCGLTSGPSSPTSSFVLSMNRTASTASERHLPLNYSNILFDYSDRRSLSSKSSFPSIHFVGDEEEESPGTTGDSSDSELDEDDGSPSLRVPATPRLPTTPRPTMTHSMLYIQMEFVERQTLKERIDEGITEQEAWGLFQQILEALVYMSSMSILHRDIKLTNIFIDAKGDCKIGDFGLATTSLATAELSDMMRSPHSTTTEADMTLEVGTRLYIAPEVLSRKRGPRNHDRADMYSFGIVFFEMNYTFSTGSERIAVLENLRKPEIHFPSDWDPSLISQREIITWLLQHPPENRPTALELSQSPLIPQRLEDEYFKGALTLMTKPDSPHHQAVLSSLFSQLPRQSRGFIYDLEVDIPEHAALNDIVLERLAAIFRLHGAVNMEAPLMMPVLDVEDQAKKAAFIDKHGDLVTLPDNMIMPFARLAARGSIKRIKRYHLGDIYKPNPVAGHPKVQKSAIFDIITPDLSFGPIASGAELIAVANNCLDQFPNLSHNYDIHVSHSKIIDVVLTRLPSSRRDSVVEIMSQHKSSLSQKRALLLRGGLLRSMADELEVLAEIDEDIDSLIYRLEKLSPTLVNLIQPFVTELHRTVDFVKTAKVTRPLFFHPLMLGAHNDYFKDGVLIQVVKKNKRSDIFAIGGRYDNLITGYIPLKSQREPVCAMGLQIAAEKITVALASFQSSSVKTLVKEQRSFGFWSPRRCDVYVVSSNPGHLHDRLEIVSYLWQHNISADFMYEHGLRETDHENYVDMCLREGILFTVMPRPHAARRDYPAFRIKSILKGSVADVSKQELIPWLQHEIAEQKRIDYSTTGATPASPTIPHSLGGKDVSVSPDVQLVLPTDMRKQKKFRRTFLDRAFETSSELRSAIQAGLPMLAVDVPVNVFDNLTRNSNWISEEEAWKTLLATFPTTMNAYAQQIREAGAKFKAERHCFLLVFAVREEKVQLLTL